MAKFKSNKVTWERLLKDVGTYTDAKVVKERGGIHLLLVKDGKLLEYWFWCHFHDFTSEEHVFKAIASADKHGNYYGDNDDDDE